MGNGPRFTCGRAAICETGGASPQTRFPDFRQVTGANTRGRTSLVIAVAISSLMTELPRACMWPARWGRTWPWLMEFFSEAAGQHRCPISRILGDLQPVPAGCHSAVHPHGRVGAAQRHRRSGCTGRWTAGWRPYPADCCSANIVSAAPSSRPFRPKHHPSAATISRVALPTFHTAAARERAAGECWLAGLPVVDAGHPDSAAAWVLTHLTGGSTGTSDRPPVPRGSHRPAALMAGECSCALDASPPWSGRMSLPGLTGRDFPEQRQRWIDTGLRGASHRRDARKGQTNPGAAPFSAPSTAASPPPARAAAMVFTAPSSLVCVTLYNSKPVWVPVLGQAAAKYPLEPMRSSAFCWEEGQLMIS